MMFNLLAEVGPPPEGFDKWLACFMYVIVSVTAVVALINQFRRKPSVEVELKDFATKESLAKIELMIPTLATREELQELGEKLSDVISDEVKRLDNRRSVSVANLHEQLKAAEVGLSAVKNESQHHTREISTLTLKVDNLLARPRRA